LDELSVLSCVRPLEFDADGNLRDYVARDFSPDSTG